MAEKLTLQQQMAVNDRGGRLLVSAAAGSGKTKVLVDRLLSYITDPVNPANIDEFLIITYTKAAAAELRSKIASKLSQKIAEKPENKHLQRQMQKLYLTKISTVHAYCTDLLREFAYTMDLPADFRVADERESLELQLVAMDSILEDAYDTLLADSDFVSFVDSQGIGRDDRQVPEILLKVYNSARCHLNPEKWLDWCMEIGNFSEDSDAGSTVWGQYLMDQLKSYAGYHIEALRKCANLAKECDGFEKPAALLFDTVAQLEKLQNSTTWDDVVNNSSIDYGRLTFPKNCSNPELSECIKAVRSACKKGLEKKLRCFTDSSKQVVKDMLLTANAANGMIRLVRTFSQTYDALKKRRRVLDFGDLEHRVLDLLLGKQRNHPTAIAMEVGKRFREVMVDEYQDSNEVQDAIFTALTSEKDNCFMVGDVKQSIYQFRLADPTIFLKKYNDYARAGEAAPKQGRKVMLSSNFRSASAVIEAVNDVFRTCMSETTGGLKYGDDEALNEGIPHVTIQEPEVELHSIVVKEDTYAEEAAFTAERIRQLIEGEHYIRGENDTLRRITPEDIVILLRSPGSVGGEFAYALRQIGIRCIADSAMDLLQTEEIIVFRSLLQVIANPLQDIPLLAVLSSRLFSFTANDLVKVRCSKRHAYIYNALNECDLPKARAFITTLNQIRAEARNLDLSSLLELALATTRLDSIYAALPDGEERIENLHNFCQIASEYEQSCGFDLTRFLEYLDAMDDRGLSPSMENTSKGAVRIMSIHKSKGLEFPVVFLCSLSRSFNKESASGNVLCEKTLGLGLSCVDTENRVRYPSIAKRAISGKILADGLSEEMRVLYVAMTRARDRLVMTYASQSLENELKDLSARLDISGTELLAMDADCPGKWILITALQRTEAGELFAMANKPACTTVKAIPWLIRAHDGMAASDSIAVIEEESQSVLDARVPGILRNTLNFVYEHRLATTTPSKITATQLKGRLKDAEIAENAANPPRIKKWRKPSFLQDAVSGKDYGNAFHAALQFLDYKRCCDENGIRGEIKRLTDCGYLCPEQRDLIDVDRLVSFFNSPIGMKIRSSDNVLREFKFTILNDGTVYDPTLINEKILMQGVIDCAVIEEDGITVIDFKTDRVNEESVAIAVNHYRPQVEAYADAISRIYKTPVKAKYLYFFHMNKEILID